MPESTPTERLARIQQEFAEIDPVVHSVLKGHLLIEEKLSSIIELFVFHPEAFDEARLGFFHKVHVARALSLDEHENSMWQLILSINSLRNELAHSLDPDARRPKILRLRELYFKEIEDESYREEQQDYPDEAVVMFASVLAIGFLGRFEQEAKRFRSIVDGLDRVMNPHRHQEKSSDSSTDEDNARR